MDFTTPEPLVISSFTHKGGVGKTTGFHNIAPLLSKELKFRVLLIDCDPQCSLTSVILHEYFVKIGKKEAAKRKLTLSETGLKQLGEEIFYEKIETDPQPARPNLRQNSQANTAPKRRTVYESFKCKDLAYFADEENLKRVAREEIELVHLEEYGELYVLPGDLMLNTLEVHIAGGFSYGRIEALRQHQKIPGLITQMFREIARQRKFDIVLIDLSPAATFFNQSIVMCSDYFIISNLADYYSRRSIISIADVLKTWNKDVDFLRNIESPFFKFPPCPKLLGQIFHRVKVHNGLPTSDKQEKIDLIQDEIRKRFLDTDVLGGSDSIVTDGFKLYDPPIIKEFDRFNDQAIERGIPMIYINEKNIKLEDNKKESPSVGNKKVENTRKFYMNSYFAAISIIFSNLSDEHHLRLGNLFKPPQTADNATTALMIQDQYEFVGVYEGELLTFNMRRMDDAYKAFVPEEAYIPRTLRSLNTAENAEVKSLFFQEISDAFLPNGEKNDQIRDPRFDRVFDILESKREAKDESKSEAVNAVIERHEELKGAEDLEELDLLALTHLCGETQNYMGNCLQEKAAIVAVNRYLQSDKGKESYIKNLEEQRIKVGAKGYRLCALAKGKNLRVWEAAAESDDRRKLWKLKIKEVQVSEDNPDEFIDLLEISKNEFRKLIPKKVMNAKVSTESSGLNQKRANLHGSDGPALNKKVKKR